MQFKNCEIVYFDLWDVGTSIDMKRVADIFPGSQTRTFRISRNTPNKIVLPKPINIHYKEINPDQNQKFSSLKLYIQIYEEGVISLITRVKFKEASLKVLNLFKNDQYVDSGNNTKIKLRKWVYTQFWEFYAKIKPFITRELYKFTITDPESYSVFCFRDPNLDFQDILDNNREEIAKFLNRVQSSSDLHKSQIDNILSHQFSYFAKDRIIFEAERTIIMDPYEDYEDVLQIIELANYMSLEFQTLDRILDKWLNEAELETNASLDSKKEKISRKIKLKEKKILKLRTDALFMLENLENVSKIIGDFFLGQLFKHICNLFELTAWSISIRNRLQYLSDIYSLATQNSFESRMWKMEILMASFFVIEIVLFLIEIFRI